MQPITEEDCTPEQWKLFLKMAAERERAAELATKVEQTPPNNSVDVADAHVEFLFTALVRAGVIDLDTYINIRWEWEHQLCEQLEALLNEKVEAFQNYQREMRKLRRKQQEEVSRQLLVPRDKQLILPQGVKMPDKKEKQSDKPE